MIRSVGALKNIWKIPELKRKVLYTLMMLAIFRIGANIPTPFIDRAQLQDFIQKTRSSIGGGLFDMVDLFSGRAFREMSILALGIMPYISVQIIIELLTVVYPRLQKIKDDGPLGQRKINNMTRKFTILLGLFQSFAVALTLQRNHLTYLTGGYSWIFMITTMVAMTTGTAFLMWLGERITDDGVGNGISLIIAVGIMCSYPADFMGLFNQARTGNLAPIWAIVIVILFIISTVAIIIIQDGTRRIPMQHAKRQVGRQVMTGGSNYLPLKVNTANVIPVIFSSAMLAFPGFIASVLSNGAPGGGTFGNFFSPVSTFNLYDGLGLTSGGAMLVLKSVNAYIILFAVLTGFFCFFYTAVTFNPDEIANNLKKSGSFIPGKRPGKPTSEYIDYVLTRITTFGAVFLVVIAIVPLILETSYHMPAQAGAFVGGTGLIIVIGVLVDTLKQVESQLLMRHYEGFTVRKSGSRWR